MTGSDFCRKHGISSATFYAWKAKFGGMDVSDAKRLKALEDENAKLKKLPAKQTLDMIGVPRTTFYRWYDRYLSLGATGLEDRPSHPGRVWNWIPDKVRRRIVGLALEQPELSPRELAVRLSTPSQISPKVPK